ncbi:hypothetical protein BJX76DRAFT_326140, partial [Aspergillus varians]
MGVRIRVQHMSLDKNSDQRPNFFLPSSEYPPFDQDEELNEFYEDMAFEAPYLEAPVERARQVHGIWLDFAFNWRPGKPDINLWYAGCVADHTPYKPLTPINQSSEFGAWNIWDIRRPQGKFPHSKAAVYSNRVGKNGEILRGELLAVLRLMLGRLKKRIFIEHMTAPVNLSLLFPFPRSAGHSLIILQVFILSFMGKHARAVESYFDGEYLHLRITRLYNFPEETEPAIKIFSEWFAGDPTGDTS